MNTIWKRWRVSLNRNSFRGEDKYGDNFSQIQRITQRIGKIWQCLNRKADQAEDNQQLNEQVKSPAAGGIRILNDFLKSVHHDSLCQQGLSEWRSYHPIKIQ